MIKQWLITGDTHGKILERLYNMRATPEDAVIVLGDCGINYYLNKTDKRIKEEITSPLYLVRGNHEARPQDLYSTLSYDHEVCGDVYVDSTNPLIRYFRDGGIYTINGHSILTIGGAYSVDKWYRLIYSGYTEETNNPAKTGWFPNEQLTYEERKTIFDNVKGKSFDFVFSHTCPYSWMPTDLFLPNIDQTRVDNSMELWFEALKNNIDWNRWCFGHFHADRIERPHVKQFYYSYQELESLYNELS